jgi:hypothetical protein
MQPRARCGTLARMSFNLEQDLFIDIDAPGGAACLLDGKSSNGLQNSPTYIQADCFPLHLYFRARNGAGTPSDNIDLATLNILLGAMVAPADASEIFSANSFVSGVDADGDTYYAAALNLDTTELATALSGKKSITATVTLEIENPDNSARLSYQFQVTIQATTSGATSPTPATPAYPAPSLLVTKIRGTVALTSGASVIAVTGLNLPSVPAQVLLTIRKPTAGADNVPIGGVADDSLSVDGFSVALTAAVPTSGYKLDYLVIL